MISVIVPVYNNVQFLQECIDSILAQSILDFELILVDDGSTDGSGQLCDQNLNKDSRIRVIHQANAGVTAARKAGVMQSAGRYICFVDSDDTIEKDYLQNLCNGIQNECQIVSIQGRNGVISHHDYISGMLKGGLHWPLCFKLFSSDVLTTDAFDFPRAVNTGEDFISNIRIAKHISGVSLIPYGGYFYRDNPDSISHTKRFSYENETLFMSELDKALGKDFESYTEDVWHFRMKSWKLLLLNKVKIPKDSPWIKWCIENESIATTKNLSEKALLNTSNVFIQTFLLSTLDNIQKLKKSIKHTYHKNPNGKSSIF